MSDNLKDPNRRVSIIPWDGRSTSPLRDSNDANFLSSFKHVAVLQLHWSRVLPGIPIGRREQLGNVHTRFISVGMFILEGPPA